MARPSNDAQDDDNENNDNPPSLEALGVHPHITPYLLGLCLVALIWYNVSSNMPMINNLLQNYLHNQLAGISTAVQTDLPNMTENLPTGTTSWQHNKFSLESGDEHKFDIHINLDLNKKLPVSKDRVETKKSKMRLKLKGDVSNNFNKSLEKNEPQDLIEEPGDLNNSVETSDPQHTMDEPGEVSNNFNNSQETSNPQKVCSEPQDLMDEPGDVSNNFNNSQETNEPQHLMEEPVKQETGDETATDVHSSGPEMPTPPNMPVAQVAEKKEEQEPVDRKEKSRTSTSSGEPQQDSVTTSQEMPSPPNVPMLPEAEKREELETVNRKENKPSREQAHPPG